jgi:ADP-ribose pyrophosphatase
MFKTLAEKLIYRNRWMELWEDEIEFPDGHKGIYSYTTRVDAGPMIIPQIDENHFLVLKEWRYPIKDWSYCFPAGGVNGPDEPMLEAATRELQEETGARATEWIELGSILFNPSATTQRMPLFLARGITFFEKKLDLEEVITQEILSTQQIESMIAEGKIDNALFLAAWAKLKVYLKNKAS